jgi:hypothetical protein
MLEPPQGDHLMVPISDKEVAYYATFITGHPDADPGPQHLAAARAVLEGLAKDDRLIEAPTWVAPKPPTQSAQTDRPTGASFRTFEEAELLGAYPLARLWSDTMRLPVDIPAETARKAGVAVRTVEHDLDEVAVMAALASWLRRWLPISMHRALLRGASIEEVAAASGVEFREATRMWREWSDGQRHLQREMPHLPDHTAEHDRVDELIRSAAHDRTLPRPVGNLRLRVPPAMDEPHGYENCGCCQAQDYEAPDDGEEPLDVACVNCGHSPEEHEPA